MRSDIPCLGEITQGESIESSEATTKDSALEIQRIRREDRGQSVQWWGVRPSAVRSQEGNPFYLEVNINLEG